MDDKTVRQNIAVSLQSVLRAHEVSPESLGDTMDFLANIIGATAGMLFPSITIDGVIEKIRDEIENGMENGMPEV
jgi:hypothetical protein